MQNQKAPSPVFIFFTGLLAGISAAVFFCRVFTGNPLDLVFPSLIFLLCVLISSAFSISGKWSGFVLLVTAPAALCGFCLPDDFFPGITGIAGGIVTGLLLRDVFQLYAKEQKLPGIFAVGLTAGLLSGWLPECCFPYILCGAYLVFFLFYREWHIVLRIFAVILCGLLFAAVLEFSLPLQEKRSYSRMELDLMAESVEGTAHLVLAVVPDNSVFPKEFSDATYSSITALRPGQTIFPRTQMREIRELFDLILLEVPQGAYSLLTRESFAEMRSLLRQSGTLFLLPSPRLLKNWNANVAGTLRAALQTAFPYVYATSHIPMILASASPIPQTRIESGEMLELVKPLLFQQEWNQTTADAARSAEIPSDSKLVLESLLFRETQKPAWFHQILHWLAILRKYALWIFGSVIGVGLLFRYAAAYHTFFAAAFPVWEDSFCIGTTIFFLLYGRVLQPMSGYGWIVLAGGLILLGFFSELPKKKGIIQRTILRWIAVLLPLPAWLLIPYTGECAMMGALLIALFAGSCGAVLLQEEQRYFPQGKPFCPLPVAAGAWIAVLLSGCLLMPEYGAVLTVAGMLSGISFRK